MTKFVIFPGRRTAVLRRKAYQLLLDWKKSQSRKRKALFVTGARQIGKSYLIQHLGRTEYASLVEINLLRDKVAKETLAAARSTQDFINRLAVLSEAPFIEGDTLVFIDEIQELPDVATYAKFLVEDGRYDYAFSGSMLGTEFKSARSFPVGYVAEIEMRPMDFEEFCWAVSVQEAMLEQVCQSFAQRKPLEAYLHEHLLSQWRTYLVVGGMPEVVQQFVDGNGSLAGIRALQVDLNQQYSYDIAKYAGARALHVQSIFEELPVQLEEERAKFVVTSLGETARYDNYEQDFLWLVRAGVGLKVNKVTEPKPPLRRTQRAASFKLYQSDTGMLVARFPQSLARAVYTDDRSVNMGGVFENAVAQELVAAQFTPYYYLTKKVGEVDFLIESDEGVVAIEVKSGNDYLTHASLSKVLAAPEYEVSRAIVLCRSNFEMRDGILYAPWYATLCFESLNVSDDFFLK